MGYDFTICWGGGGGGEGEGRVGYQNILRGIPRKKGV